MEENIRMLIYIKNKHGSKNYKSIDLLGSDEYFLVVKNMS